MEGLNEPAALKEIKGGCGWTSKSLGNLPFPWHLPFLQPCAQSLQNSKLSWQAQEASLNNSLPPRATSMKQGKQSFLLGSRRGICLLLEGLALAPPDPRARASLLLCDKGTTASTALGETIGLRMLRHRYWKASVILERPSLPSPLSKGKTHHL